jgi:hypothetical protein
MSWKIETDEERTELILKLDKQLLYDVKAQGGDNTKALEISLMILRDYFRENADQVMGNLISEKEIEVEYLIRAKVKADAAEQAKNK